MKCKNTDCPNEVIGKRQYCSLTCRNVYVNKHLRNYDKVSETLKNKRKEKEEEYLKLPKYCKFCGEIIPFEKRDNTYCNSSCMASATNPNKNHTWGDKIRDGIYNYLISNGIRKEGEIGLFKKKCIGCDCEFSNKRNDVKYCSPECRKRYKRRHLNEYQKYRLDCNFRFNLSDYPDYFDFSLIEKYGWYSPTNKKNNLEGVSRDHIFSVREGFELGIDPKIISHPANCRLMKHTDNISKNKKSSITLEELLQKINEFDGKFE